MRPALLAGPMERHWSLRMASALDGTAGVWEGRRAGRTDSATMAAARGESDMGGWVKVAPKRLAPSQPGKAARARDASRRPTERLWGREPLYEYGRHSPHANALPHATCSGASSSGSPSLRQSYWHSWSCSDFRVRCSSSPFSEDSQND